MKAREILYILGFRPAPRSYGFEIDSFDLPRDGHIEFARWLHPREKPKTFPQEAIDQLRVFLSPGDLAIDIGAHSGDSALPLALAVGKQGTVLALEPNSYVFPILQKNSELNPEKTNIVPLPFAATPGDGEYEFEYGDAGYCNGGLHNGVGRWKHGLAFKLKVNGRRLGEFLEKEYPQLLPKLRYIKVDAEGYDFTILSSLSEIIARYRPYLRAEVYKWTTRAERQQLLQFVIAAGYSPWRLEDESNYCAEPVTVDRVMDWVHYDVFAVPHGAATPFSERAKDRAARR
jgi:FkbM family methyltransferase